MTTIAQKLDRNIAAPTLTGNREHAASRAAAVPAEVRLNVALAVLRGIVGTVFLAHGAQKLFVFGVAGVTGAFEGMGVPLAGIAGPGVALLELVGGLALIGGILTRAFAAGLAAIMLGALVLVHLPAGFFLPAGVEFVLTLFGASVALALTGPGNLSLDALLSRYRAEA
jgi:putative oxidoreductase